MENKKEQHLKPFILLVSVLQTLTFMLNFSFTKHLTQIRGLTVCLNMHAFVELHKFSKYSVKSLFL